jgi:hypothetical protein
MKKIFYTLLIGLCIGKISVNAQTTFNKLYQEGIGSSIFGMSNDNNNYFLFYMPQNIQPQKAMAVTKIDAVGNQVRVDTLHLRDNSLVEGVSTAYSSIKAYDNKVIMVLTINKSCTNCIEGCIVKFNTSMTDTLWTKTYKFQG